MAGDQVTRNMLGAGLLVVAASFVVHHLASIPTKSRLASVESAIDNRVTLESLEVSDGVSKKGRDALLGVFAEASAKQTADIMELNKDIRTCQRQIKWVNEHLSILFERLGQGRRPTGLGEMPE